MFNGGIHSLYSSANATLGRLVNGTLQTPRQLDYQLNKTYRYTYDVSVTTTSFTRDAEGVNEQDGSKTILSAIAEVTITEKQADGQFVGQIILRDPFVCMTDGSHESKVDNSQFVNAFGTPILFKQMPSGVITSISLLPSSDPTVTNMQKGVINALQMTLREDTDSYTAQEKGGQGTYVVDYTLEDKTDGLHIAKTYDQDSFSALVTQGDDSGSLSLDTSLVAVLDGSQGVLTSVKSTETVSSGDGQAQPGSEFSGVTTWTTAESTGALTLKEVKNADAARAAAVPLAAYEEGDLTPIFPEARSNRRGIDLANVNLDQEMAALEAAPTDAHGTRPGPVGCGHRAIGSRHAPAASDLEREQ